MWGFLTDLTTENSPLGLFNAFCSVIAVRDPSFLREVASTEHQDELLAGSQRPQVRSSLSKKFPLPQGLGLATKLSCLMPGQAHLSAPTLRTDSCSLRSVFKQASNFQT